MTPKSGTDHVFVHGGRVVDGPADIHAVENPPQFREGAASLHIYSKPYAECDIYDSETGPRRRVKLLYDTIEGKPADRLRG